MIQKQPKATALDNFIMYSTVIDQQLITLKAMLDDQFGYSPDEIHWGHTGTAQHIHEQLTEVLISLNGFAKGQAADKYTQLVNDPAIVDVE